MKIKKWVTKLLRMGRRKEDTKYLLELPVAIKPPIDLRRLTAKAVASIRLPSMRVVPFGRGSTVEWFYEPELPKLYNPCPNLPLPYVGGKKAVEK